MDHTMHPELDNVLQSLLLNGYSVFSLIDDILAHDRNREDQRIMLLRGGVERDVADICARLLGYDPTSASVSAWARGVVQMTQRSAVEENISEERGSHSTADHRLSLQKFFGKVQSKNCRRGATIDVLPDNAFLEIFDFCLREPITTQNRMQVFQRMKKWQILVQVCQRWRRTIFASPQRLDLHLSCSYGTPVRQNLGFWPATLPLTIDYPGRIDFVYDMGLAPEDEDNVLAALRHASRVHRIDILASGPLLKCMVTVMQKPFPALIHLDLNWDTKVLPARGAPILPDGRFLGGTAPRLQYLRLKCVSFPYLPTFLLSARNLVTLKLKDIYQNGYISPEAMVEGLAVLTRLKTLSISFRSGTSPPDQMGGRPDPPIRIILPALTAFHYIGRCEYLEDFLAQIDTPQLCDLRIEYFKRQIQATPGQLSRFVDRTENLKPDQFSRAKATFFYEDIYVKFDCPQGSHRKARLSLSISGQAWLDAQVPCVAHVLCQLVPLFSNVDHLDAHGDHVHSREMGITDWLPFFRLFAAVKTLHLSGGVAAYIASALEDAADPEDMITDVFPVLRLIWLDEAAEDEDEDGPMGSIEQFLSMRQLSDHPVTVVDTEDEFDRRR
ncbi:hypothetical protein EDB84DRAFT_1130057 [Lactarius hengduanensis]|nr:hypothetical protein EDB84DRAFT_1130057 [Lactarius hengduanensis]